MKSYERPQKWIYATELFSQENQMMTPKMSLRRNNILKTYGEKIADVYENKSGVQLKKTSINTNEI